MSVYRVRLAQQQNQRAYDQHRDHHHLELPMTPTKAAWPVTASLGMESFGAAIEPATWATARYGVRSFASAICIAWVLS